MSIDRLPTIEIIGPESPLWNEYVDTHPQGTVFHTSEMIEVFRATPKYKPYSIAAMNEDGKVVAVLASVQVSTAPRLAGRLAARSIMFSEPLCDDSDEGFVALKQLVQLHDERVRTSTLYCEVRSIGAPGTEQSVLESCGHDHLDYLNYIVDLTPDAEQLWRNIPKKMRQKIRATARRDVIVADATSEAGINEMYELVRFSYARSRVPLVDVQIFHEALRLLPAGTVRVRTAYDQDQPVASIISLVHRGRVFSWYGGTLRLNGKSPFGMIVWDDIEWGSKNGQQVYDFGGAGWPEEDYGPRRIKASFGGQQVCYGRYRKTYSRWRQRLAETAYQMTRTLGLWSLSSTGPRASRPSKH